MKVIKYNSVWNYFTKFIFRSDFIVPYCLIFKTLFFNLEYSRIQGDCQEFPDDRTRRRRQVRSDCDWRGLSSDFTMILMLGPD